MGCLSGSATTSFIGFLIVLVCTMAISISNNTVQAFVMPASSSFISAHTQQHLHQPNRGSGTNALRAHVFATEAYLAQLSSSSIVSDTVTPVTSSDPYSYVHQVAAHAADLTATWPQNEELWQRIAQAAEYSAGATASSSVVESTMASAGSSTLLNAAVSNNNLFSTTTLGDVAQSAADVVVKGSQGFATAASNALNNVNNMPQQFIQGTEKQVDFVATAELVDLGKAAAGVVVKVAEAILVVFNVLLEALTGMTVADVIQTAQTAVQDLVSSSTQAVAAALEQIGSMTLEEAAVSVFRVVVAVTTILFRIFSGVLELVTGKTAGEWAITAKQAVAAAAQDAMAAAAHTASDMSHKSLTELVALMGQWETDMTQTVVATAQQALTNEPFLSGTVTLSSLGGNIQ
jgi:hypothetical protein